MHSIISSVKSLFISQFKVQLNNKITAIGLCLLSCNSFAAGLLTPTNSDTAPLEIKEHHVTVTIDDGYAVTSVEQVFFNASSQELEAKYSFPVPEKAAVGEFTYWIDGQPVTGEVVKKAKAAKIYQQEKQAGREVALTNKNNYQNFESLVYPVRTQQYVRIKLVYIQPAHVDTSIGRYVYPLEDGGTDQQKLSFWRYNDKVTEQFSFNLRFRSSYPIDQFRLPKHPHAKIIQLSATEWSVSINNGAVTSQALEQDLENNSTGTVSKINSHAVEQQAPFTPSTQTVQALDKDIVVYWRHQANLPGRVELVTYKEADNNRGTFMMTLTPGDDLAQITEGRDWVFVLDYSGSMNGKYQSMVEGVQKGLAKLNPEDRFRIIIFNNDANEITNDYIAATQSNINYWSTRLLEQTPNGSTNLYDGIKLGIKRLDADRSSALVLVTDGVANVGSTQRKRFLTLLEQHDVRLFTFVMGNSTNRPLLEGMVNVSNGFAINVSNSDDIVGQLMQATSKLTHQALHDVNVHFSGVKVKALTPDRIGSLYRGEQLIVMGHYWGDGAAEITVKGKVSGQTKTYKTQFNFTSENTVNPEIERLWAYSAIEDMQNQMDYLGHDQDTEKAITDLAIDYGLVTNYTSMLVLREEQFAHYNIARNNQKRVTKEQQKREHRKTLPVRNNRVDSQQPMYSNNSANHSGGGGSTGLGMLGCLALLIIKRKYLIST